MRVDDWEPRLVDVFRKASIRPYDARKWNCVLFTKECVEAVSGQEIPKKWKGSIEATTDAVLSRINPRQAMRGDVVLANVPEPSLGVCTGRVATFVTTEGLMAIPMSQVSVAWRV